MCVRFAQFPDLAARSTAASHALELRSAGGSSQAGPPTVIVAVRGGAVAPVAPSRAHLEVLVVGDRRAAAVSRPAVEAALRL
jgi:hypothetical protein